MQDNCCIKLGEALNAGLRQFLVLDNGSQFQFSFRHLPGAVNIPFEWLKENLSSITASSNFILIGNNKSDSTEHALELLYK
jgi:hypothetical protein